MYTAPVITALLVNQLKSIYINAVLNHDFTACDVSEEQTTNVECLNFLGVAHFHMLCETCYGTNYMYKDTITSYIR